MLLKMNVFVWICIFAVANALPQRKVNKDSDVKLIPFAQPIIQSPQNHHRKILLELLPLFSIGLNNKHRAQHSNILRSELTSRNSQHNKPRIEQIRHFNREYPITNKIYSPKANQDIVIEKLNAHTIDFTIPLSKKTYEHLQQLQKTQNNPRVIQKIQNSLDYIVQINKEHENDTESDNEVATQRTPKNKIVQQQNTHTAKVSPKTDKINNRKLHLSNKVQQKTNSKGNTDQRLNEKENFQNRELFGVDIFDPQQMQTSKREIIPLQTQQINYNLPSVELIQPQNVVPIIQPNLYAKQLVYQEPIVPAIQQVLIPVMPAYKKHPVETSTTQRPVTEQPPAVKEESKREKVTLVLRPQAKSVAGEDGTAIATPVARAVLQPGTDADILFEPEAFAIAGPGGLAHAQSELELTYDYSQQ